MEFLVKVDCNGVSVLQFTQEEKECSTSAAEPRHVTVKRKIHQDLFHIVNKTSLASSCVLYLPDWK